MVLLFLLSTLLIFAIKHKYHAQKIRVISFFKKGKSFFPWFALFIFMIYVMNKSWFQDVLMARYSKFDFGSEKIVRSNRAWAMKTDY